MLIIPAVSSAQVIHSNRPDTAKKCAVCHFQWVYQFQIEHRDGELASSPLKPVAADQQMCFSCHDGSVADSRDGAFYRHGHPVGVVPSKNVTIPEDFPLDLDGKVQCATCHTPHALPGDKDLVFGLFLRAENKDSALCRICHPEKSGGAMKGNHPCESELIKLPNQILNNGGRAGASARSRIICETCHVVHGGKENSKLLVLPVDGAVGMSGLCESCHVLNRGFSKKSVSMSGSHPVNVKMKKNQISSKWSSGRKLRSGNNGRLLCVTCHSPHGAADNDALLSEHNSRDSMCVQCHKGQNNISMSDHDLRLSSPYEKNIKGMKASETGPCSSCHLVHNGTGSLMWARKAVSNKSSMDAYCFSCHLSGQCGEKAMPGDFSHPLDVGVSGLKIKINLPVYNSKGEKDRSGKIRCMTCHDLHNPSPLYKNPESGEVKKGYFLRMSNKYPSAVCTHCHPDQAFVRGSDHDLRVTSPVHKNVLNQTVSGGGVCSSCHAAHNAPKKKYIWSGKSGKPVLDGWNNEYASHENVMVSMCTGCHSPGNAGSDHIPMFGLHPGGLMVPTEMIQSEKNEDKKEFPLYSNSGELSLSGNIVCSTCHNPHQWNQIRSGKDQRADVEGNVTNSFLRSGIHESLCAACHGEDSLLKFAYFHRLTGRKK